MADSVADRDLALALVALVVVQLPLHFTRKSPAGIRRHGRLHLQSSNRPVTMYSLPVSR